MNSRTIRLANNGNGGRKILSIVILLVFTAIAVFLNLYLYNPLTSEVTARNVYQA